MLRIFYILLLCLSVLTVNADNRGIPFIRNFQSTEYGAHSRSFDVGCDDYGSVYFANFEGILYFDGASWRTIRTDRYIDASTGRLVTKGNIYRTTRLVWDKLRKKIWVGGFNYFGFLMPDDKGVQQLCLLHTPDRANDFGEVDMIKLYGKEIYVHVLDGRVYKVNNPAALGNKPPTLQLYHGNTSFINTNMEIVALGYTSCLNLSYRYGHGVTVRDGNRIRTISEVDGLCSDNVNFVMYDRQHTVWGATDHGIFAIEMPSPFSHITEGQGLKGDVYCINNIGSTLYVGTLHGLYRIGNGKVSKVPGINLACWQLSKEGNSLYVSTTTGVYHITETRVKQIESETESSYATIPAPQGGYYTALNDSIYYVPDEDDDVHFTCLANIEKANKLLVAGKYLIVETINGQKWSVSLVPPYKKKCLRADIDYHEPKIEYIDAFDRTWKTSPTGDSLTVVGHEKIQKWANPLANKILNAIHCGRDNSLWVGGDFGVINCDLDFVNRMKQVTNPEPIFIRQVVLGDSTLWGGYTKEGYKPLTKVTGIHLSSSSHDLKVFFSSQYQSFICPTRYCYRTKNGFEEWSAWSTPTTETYVLFHNLSYGDTEMEIKAIDLFGNESLAYVSWTVEHPFYMQWWACLIYIIILTYIGRAITKYRMKKLERDKMRLEEVVNKRTAELRKTQKELVQAERTATAGKLTQGLIDRILNPINYINNFSKLTSNLAKDLKEDIEDEKDNMSEDNYEDCEDILDMMHQNLTKIEEHGVNTTRTLRSMEALLNHQTGSLHSTDISALCHQVEEVVADHYKELIANLHINFTTEIPDGITHDVDPESLSNVLKALLANAFYAVEKRLTQKAYDNPEVKLIVSQGSSTVSHEPSTMNHSDGDHVTFIIHDNGIGIESTILEKIFDPFFTTKPTSEASGVGLYLAREIIQDHKGTITVASEKESHTDFTITL